MTPPRLATWLVRQFAGRNQSSYVLSDLAEEFDLIVRNRGPREARRWYWSQAIASVLPLLSTPVSRTLRLARLHVRDGVRFFRRAPFVSSIVVVTLALGIGANTAVFSVVDALLLRPLPYADPEYLVSLREHRLDASPLNVSARNFVDYARLDRPLIGLAGYTRATQVLGGSTAPEEVPIDLVTWNLWSILGVQPAFGRDFRREDAVAGAEPVAIVADGLSLARFGSPLSALGQAIAVDGVRRTVIGVMPSAFIAPSQYGTPTPAVAFVPLPEFSEASSRGDHTLRVIGRLRTGVAVAQAQSELTKVSTALASGYPETNRHIRAAIAPLADDVAQVVRGSLGVIVGAVVVIVFIACINVANLLLAWAAGRQRDAAIRLALGATRADIVAEHIARGLLLGAVGGAGAIVCGVWVLRGLLALAPPSIIPHAVPIDLNVRVLAFCMVLSISVGLVAGILPAWQVLRRHFLGLRDQAVSVLSARWVARWRGSFVMAEVASALVLALGAGLLMRSLILLNRVELGFDVDRVVTMSVRLPVTRYADADARLRFFEHLTERIRLFPGVEAVAYANQFPLQGGWGGRVRVEGASGPIDIESDLQAVSPDYFKTLGMRIQRGRALNAGDRTGSTRVAVVSQTFVDRFLPGQDPIGVVIRRHAAAPALTIVGVVDPVRRAGKLADAAPQVYLSSLQTEVYAVDLWALAVRTTMGNTSTAVPQIRAEVRALDAALVVGGVRKLQEILDADAATRRFHSWLLTIFAVLSVALATVGVYGVVRYAVVARTRELGLRLALGATRGHVIGVAVASGLGWVAGGIAIGLTAAAGTSQLLTSLLFQTSPHDLGTYASVSVFLTLVSVAAAYFPARRAAASDPVAALRAE